LRESLILGLVGAGGIGLYIQLYARAFQYEKVTTLTLVVLLMVWSVEQVSIAIRKRLRWSIVNRCTARSDARLITVGIVLLAE
jgi:hypothetical protein